MGLTAKMKSPLHSPGKGANRTRRIALLSAFPRPSRRTVCRAFSRPRLLKADGEERGGRLQQVVGRLDVKRVEKVTAISTAEPTRRAFLSVLLFFGHA